MHEQINKFLIALPKYRHLKLPSGGLSTDKITANENASLVLVVAPALLVHDCMKPLIPCIIGALAGPAVVPWLQLPCI